MTAEKGAVFLCCLKRENSPLSLLIRGAGFKDWKGGRQNPLLSEAGFTGIRAWALYFSLWIRSIGEIAF